MLNKSLLCLLISCFLLYFIGLGSFPSIDPAEAYYVEAAREMVELNNWIVPYLNYQVYFSKPIITFWLIASSYKLFGISELASRLPFALLSTAMVLAIYHCISKLFSQKAGLFSALCLATAPLFLLVSRISPVDIAFGFCLELSILATAMTLESKGKYWSYVIWAALALGLLTKGPATLVLYGASVVLFLIWRRPPLHQSKEWLKQLNVIPGILLFLAIAIPWHWAVHQASDGLFLKVFFLYENFARFSGHTNMGKMSWWFYIPVILAGFLPWIVCAPFCFTDYFRKKEIAMQLFLSFIATTFVIFSLSGTKLITYILPVIPMLSIVVGVFLDRWLTKPADYGKNVTTILISLGFASIASFTGVYYALPKVGVPDFWKWTVVVSSIAAGAVFAVALWKFLNKSIDRERFITTYFTAQVAYLAILCPVSFYIFGNKMQLDLKTISIKASSMTDRISLFGEFMPSAIFYAQKPVNCFFNLDQIKTQEIGWTESSKADDQLLIVKDKDLKRLSQIPGLKLETVMDSGNWHLYKTPGYVVTCVPTLEDVFKDPIVFNNLITKGSPVGPLTVPASAGRAYNRKK